MMDHELELSAPRRATGGTERMALERVSIHYCEKAAVRDVSLPIRQGEVLAAHRFLGLRQDALLRGLNHLTELTPTGAARPRCRWT